MQHEARRSGSSDCCSAPSVVVIVGLLMSYGLLNLTVSPDLASLSDYYEAGLRGSTSSVLLLGTVLALTVVPLVAVAWLRRYALDGRDRVLISFVSVALGISVLLGRGGGLSATLRSFSSSSLRLDGVQCRPPRCGDADRCHRVAERRD